MKWVRLEEERPTEALKNFFKLTDEKRKTVSDQIQSRLKSATSGLF